MDIFIQIINKNTHKKKARRGPYMPWSRVHTAAAAAAAAADAARTFDECSTDGWSSVRTLQQYTTLPVSAAAAT